MGNACRNLGKFFLAFQTEAVILRTVFCPVQRIDTAVAAIRVQQNRQPCLVHKTQILHTQFFVSYLFTHYCSSFPLKR